MEWRIEVLGAFVGNEGWCQYEGMKWAPIYILELSQCPRPDHTGLSCLQLSLNGTTNVVQLVTHRICIQRWCALHVNAKCVNPDGYRDTILITVWLPVNPSRWSSMHVLPVQHVKINIQPQARVWPMIIQDSLHAVSIYSYSGRGRCSDHNIITFSFGVMQYPFPSHRFIPGT